MFKQIIPKVDTLFSPEELHRLWLVTNCSVSRRNVWYVLKIKYPKIYFKLTDDYIKHYQNLYLLSKDDVFQKNVKKLNRKMVYCDWGEYRVY